MKQRFVRDMKAALPACLITFLMYLLCGRVYGIFPCGSNSIVWCDMEQQAVPLLVQLRTIVQSGESLTYTLLDAGGMEFYGVFFFFLSNPLSFLILVTDIPADLLVNLLVFIKLALASGTAAIWLRHRVPELPASSAVLFAVMYGCSGYGLFYYQNLMWLEIMVTFPLLMLSLKHLLESNHKNRAVPYFLALCTMMVLCFYLCYMIVIFVVLYIGLSLRYTVMPERRGETARRFWLASIPAACVTAVIWLPCLLQVMHSARGSGTVAALMRAWLVNNLQDKLLLLGCTAITFAVLPTLFRGVDANRRKRDRALLMLYLAALLLDPVNMMWHTGSYQAFPFRWAMIPILLLLTRAAEQLTERSRDSAAASGTKRRPVLICLLILLGVLTADALLVCFFSAHVTAYLSKLWVSLPQFFLMLIPVLLLMIGYIHVLWQYQTRRIGVRTATFLAAMLFCAEFAMNFHCFVGSAANDDKLFGQTLSAEHAVPEDETDPLARVRLTRKYAHANMLGALGMPTLAHYTSMTRGDFMHGVKRAGYSSYWMEVNSTGGTVLSDALWHVRYQLGTQKDMPPWTEPVWTDNRLTLARSDMMLPAAFAVDAAPDTLAALPMGGRAAVQQFLAEQILHNREIVNTDFPVTEQKQLTYSAGSDGLTTCTLEDGAKEGVLTWHLFLREKQALYFDLYSQTETELKTVRDGAVNVQVNGRTVETEYPQSNRCGLVFLGEFEGDYVTVRVRVQKDFTCESFGLFSIRTDLLRTALSAADGADVTYARGVYTADYHADATKTLIFSAAYDEGFTAEINGEPAEVFRTLDCMPAVRVPAGENHVVLRYHVCGLKTGVLTAICGVLLLAVMLLFGGRIPAKVQKPADTVFIRLTHLAYGAVIGGVYCLPLILWAVGTVLALFRT